MMDNDIFLKKYMGEVTLKNGEHVKFLWSVSESELEVYRIEADALYKDIQKYRDYVREFKWAVMDDLSFQQFWIVYTIMHKHGKNYWERVWKFNCEKNKKRS